MGQMHVIGMACSPQKVVIEGRIMDAKHDKKTTGQALVEFSLILVVLLFLCLSLFSPAACSRVGLPCRMLRVRAVDTL